MKRLIPWISPALVLTFGLLYGLSPVFSLGVNQICEMLATGNPRGLMMFYHSSGPQGPLIAIAIGWLSFLTPVLKPVYLHQANLAFFGPLPGGLLTALSGTLALGFAILTGFSLGAVLPPALRMRFTKIPYLRHLLIAICAVILTMRIW